MVIRLRIATRSRNPYPLQALRDPRHCHPFILCPIRKGGRSPPNPTWFWRAHIRKRPASPR